MELKVQINEITIKDENGGQEQTIKTVRTVSEIIGYLEETEREALEDVVYRLQEKY
jgi:hypothetical protein